MTKVPYLEDDLGFPWTASLGLGWIVLILAFTSGTFGVLLALYLALWIGIKRHSFVALLGFGISIVSECVAAVLDSWHPSSLAAVWLGTTGLFIFVASTLLLRLEIIRYYHEREGWNIEIGPWFTLFFGVVYINWCLNPASLAERDTITSLNLK